MSRIPSIASQSARRRTAIGGVLLAIALLAAACSSSDDDDDAATTTTAEVAETTTSTVPSVTVDYEFDSTVSESEATQAADTMTRRLEKTGQAGSVAVVNSAGTGLEISVADVETEDEARGIVDPLTIAGALLFRPVLEGPLPAAAGETVSPDAAEVLGTAPTTSPDAADDEATTPAADDDPAGSALLVQPDSEGRVIARWRVGPSALGGGEVEDSEATTFNGNPAVQITLADTESGIGAFNAMGQACFDKSDTCPSGAYALVLDSLVATASAINTTESTYQPLAADAVIISSPAWTTEYTQALAIIVEVGAMPVGLTASA